MPQRRVINNINAEVESVGEIFTSGHDARCRGFRAGLGHVARQLCQRGSEALLNPDKTPYLASFVGHLVSPRQLSSFQSSFQHFCEFYLDSLKCPVATDIH